jgi:prophage regulatory protein
MTKASTTTETALGERGCRGSLLRLAEILAPRGPLCMSRSTFYAAVRDGRIPAPTKLGRISAWRAETIQTIIDHGIELPKGGKR